MSLATKNKLQKVVLQEIVGEYHHALVSCEHRNILLDEIKHIVVTQNAIYARCKPLSFIKDDECKAIRIGDFITIIIHEVEKEHEYRIALKQ